MQVVGSDRGGGGLSTNQRAARHGNARSRSLVYGERVKVAMLMEWISMLMADREAAASRMAREVAVLVRNCIC